MSDESLRHKCGMHPDNAAAFVRGHQTLQGATSWRLLGLDRIVAYCPWCGANLAELHKLLTEKPRQRLGYEAPRMESVPLETFGDVWKSVTVAPNEKRSLPVYVAHRRCDLHILARSPRAGALFTSISISRADGTSEEQLVQPDVGVPVEIYAPEMHDARETPPFALQPGDTLIVEVHNTTPQPLTVEVMPL